MNLQAYLDFTGDELKPTRDNWKGSCPVHSESTPSFFIHRETYLCHCFGCGVRGYLDNVLAKAYEVPAKTIRKQLGIKVDSRLISRDDNVPHIPFEAARVAGFPRITNHSFLERRGYKESTIINYEARWDNKRKRIVFPLRTLGGGVVGAVGRTVIDDPKKWYFYGPTKKGEILYSIIPVTSTLIIVEGIFDAMRLSQHGYHNVIALIGAEATPWQTRLIKQTANEVILFLDNDKAGRLGQDNLAKNLKSSVQVSIATYPENGKDPSELSVNDIVRAIESRQTYVQYISSR